LVVVVVAVVVVVGLAAVVVWAVVAMDGAGLVTVTVTGALSTVMVADVSPPVAAVVVTTVDEAVVSVRSAVVLSAPHPVRDSHIANIKHKANTRLVSFIASSIGLDYERKYSTAIRNSKEKSYIGCGYLHTLYG
jgi:hypothetical protein